MEFLSHYLSSQRKRKGEGGRWLSPMNELHNVVTQRRTIRIAPLSLSSLLGALRTLAWSVFLRTKIAFLLHSSSTGPDPWFWLYWSQLVGSENSRSGGGVALPGTQLIFCRLFLRTRGGGGVLRCAQAGNSVRK